MKSFHVVRMFINATVIRIDFDRGIATCRYAMNSPAPSIFAASIRSSYMPDSNRRIIFYLPLPKTTL